MIVAAVVGGAVCLALLARAFFSGVAEATRPTAVMEDEEWPPRWAPVARVFQRWYKEGRLTREDHTRLVTLLREEARPPASRP